MRRTLTTLLFWLAVAGATYADPLSAAELEEISKLATSPAVKSNDLDRMANRLPDLDGISSSDERLLLDAYKAISDGYSSINHFRQAYLVYRRYLELKEIRFQREFGTTVEKAQSSVNQRAAALDEEVSATRSEADQLRNSAQNYKVVRTFYKRFSALAIITMTFIFAVMLVRSGIRLNNMRRETAEVRKRISGLHRNSSLGRLWKGIVVGRRESLQKNTIALDEARILVSGLSTSGMESQLKSTAEQLNKARSSVQEALNQN